MYRLLYYLKYENIDLNRLEDKLAAIDNINEVYTYVTFEHIKVYDTALNYYIKHRNVCEDVLELLLKHGADPNKCGKYNLPPLAYMYRLPLSCILLLERYGARVYDELLRTMIEDELIYGDKMEWLISKYEEAEVDLVGVLMCPRTGQSIFDTMCPINHMIWEKNIDIFLAHNLLTELPHIRYMSEERRARFAGIIAKIAAFNSSNRPSLEQDHSQNQVA